MPNTNGIPDTHHTPDDHAPDHRPGDTDTDTDTDTDHPTGQAQAAVNTDNEPAG